MNSQQPIPDLTDEQAIKLSYRSDLPDDIHAQVSARIHNMQLKYDYEQVIRNTATQKEERV